jgi:hypothetical protein
MTIDSIITEWTYRLPKGYPTSDSDYEILRNVLSEMTALSDQAQQLIIDRAKGNNIKQTTIIKEGSPDYDAAIRSRLNIPEDQPIPPVTGTYALQKGPMSLKAEDARIFNALWPETMNSAIIGKGEIALYWLYQYQNPSVDTFDNRGDDQPDLTIGSDDVEVKSYPSHNARIGLGRFQKFKSTRQLVSIVFGIHTLAQTFGSNESERVFSDLAFGGNELTEAFKTFIAVDNLAQKAELIESFPIFKSLFDQIDLVKQELNLNDQPYEPQVAAAVLLRRILEEKLDVKPGDDGFIINTSSKNPEDIFAYQINFEALEPETILANVVINGGTIEANYKNLFGL